MGQQLSGDHVLCAEVSHVDIVSLIIGLALLVYLVIALLRPEKF